MWPLLRVQGENLTNLVTYLLLHPKLQRHFKPRLDQKPHSIKSEVMAQYKEFLDSTLYMLTSHIYDIKCNMEIIMEVLWLFSYAEFNLNPEYSPPSKAA